MTALRQSIAEASPLLGAVIDFTIQNDRAPTASEVYALAQFREAGPINRLCEALAQAGEVFGCALKVKP